MLLDENFNAKIADFGLGVSTPAKKGSTSVWTVSDSIRLAKNRGYIPQEFCDEKSEKTDVFSYGVVIDCDVYVIMYT